MLDNASHPDQVRHLLPASPHCVVLVTSRDRMTGLVARDGARRIAVNPLSPKDCVALLTKLLGEGDGVHELAELCAHLPLALRIAAANVTNSAHRSVFDYVQTLKHGNRLAALRSDEDGGAAVRSAFDLSFDRLNPLQKQAFRSLGLVRGPDFTAQTLAALADLTVPEAAGLLDQLSCKHLIEQRTPGRYGFHDLLRLYAIDQARQHGSWQKDFSHQEP